eukprot:CAMPEP_0197576080 /NCGR_PEP_ID=MMETSP1326-20131121/1233_1 /TAXON_ID=1155430 /ORGANISM="Genus nov. species nov., Strain RCC2288" /LENGTH=58 /DNA_ID=CAMNT_0043138935 /DNA_START=87 /DNA_END=260 /DNA_ORIENTATION=+
MRAPRNRGGATPASAPEGLEDVGVVQSNDEATLPPQQRVASTGQAGAMPPPPPPPPQQ